MRNLIFDIIEHRVKDLGTVLLYGYEYGTEDEYILSYDTISNTCVYVSTISASAKQTQLDHRVQYTSWFLDCIIDTVIRDGHHG